MRYVFLKLILKKANEDFSVSYHRFFFFLACRLAFRFRFAEKTMVNAKRRRRFIPGECNHVYQRTINGFVLFYDLEDFLVCYMIMSVVARKYKVSILEICFMIDHIHLLIVAETCEELAAFLRDYTSVYVLEYNGAVGRKGQMFHKSFGSAPKKGEKKTRATIVYVGNNPVEKKLCKRAEEYRWNFLKYMSAAESDSVRMPEIGISRALRRCMNLVKAFSKTNAYINYTLLRHLFEGLNDVEKESLTDYIIKCYSPFKANGISAYYENWEQMMMAMHSTTGSEHDIKETFHAGSDKIYQDMIGYLKKEYKINVVREVTVLPLDEKLRIADELKKHTGATPYEIKKFLHVR